MKKNEKERCTTIQQKGWPIATIRRCLLGAGHKGDHNFPKDSKLLPMLAQSGFRHIGTSVKIE